MSCKGNKKYCYFNKTWLTDLEFKDWLRENAKNARVFGCKYCRKDDLALSDVGKTALVRHMSSAKHQSIVSAKKENGNFFLKRRADQGSSSCKSVVGVTEDGPPPVKKQAVMVSSRDDCIKAEILYLIDCIQHGTSGRSCENKGNLFRAMFPDSDIAKNFTLERTKFSYTLNHGIAAHFKDELITAINDSPYFSVSFDESLNEAIQKCQMDVLVKFWDVKKSQSVSRYYDSRFLGHSTAEHLKSSFLSVIDNLDQDKMIQISMDGPKVNESFYKKIVELRSSEDRKPLLDLGTCNLHIIHGAFKTGATATGWKLKDAMSSSYNLLNDSPARRDDYVSHTGCNVFPLLPCSTRWTEDVPVAMRLILIWSDIKKLVAFYEALCKSRRPKCKSYENLVDAVKDDLKVCELHFLAFLSGKLKTFLTFYQSDKPLAAFLYTDLLDMITKLMKLMYNDTALTKITTLHSFRGFNLDEKAKFLNMDDFNIGTGAFNELKKLLRHDKVDADAVQQFRKQCKVFVVTVLKKLQERIPLSSLLLKCITFADPELILSDPSVAKKRLKNLCHYICGIDIISTQQSDKIIENFNTLVAKSSSSTFSSFSKYNDRLDDFYFKVLQIEKDYMPLANLLQLVFCISHGQASVERGFSLNKTAEVVNIEERTLMSKRLVMDHLVSNGLSSHEVPLTASLIKKVKLARASYSIELQKKQKEKSQAKENSQLQLLNIDIHKVESERASLVAENVTLRQEGRFMTKKGNDLNNFTYIKMAIEMNEKADKNDKTVEELDNTLKIMREKKRILVLSK